MVHKFNVEARKRLTSEERRRLLAPEETLERLGLKRSDTMADIGCGTGLFTLAAAKLSSDAMVYALDISPEMLQDMTAAAESNGLRNIIPVNTDEYDFKLGDNTADFLLVCTVLHEIDDKPRFLRECARICRPGGKIAVIEFNEANTDFGPPLAHRLKKAEITKLLAGAGFSITEDLKVSDAFFAVTAVREF